MKRAIKITSIVVIVIALIVMGLWFFARHNDEKKGQTPTTFKQFLGLSTTSRPENTVDNGLSSEFDNNFSTGSTGLSSSGNGTDGREGISGNSGGSNSKDTLGNSDRGGSPNDNVRQSSFTNETTITPTIGLPGRPSTGTGTPTPDPGTPEIVMPGKPDGPITVTPTPEEPTKPGPVTPGRPDPIAIITTNPTPDVGLSCSDADLNIKFTAEEIDKLSALQERFYAIAQGLHTDSDVKAEIANHDNFRLKLDKIIELNNYCQAKAPLITDPTLNRRVPTPFWHDITKDSVSNNRPSIENRTNMPAGFASFLTQSSNMTEFYDLGKNAIERALRLSIW